MRISDWSSDVCSSDLIKVSIADLRGDLKWPEYLDYSDRYFWAVPAGFRIGDLEQDCFLPARTGIIVADRYGAAIIREAAINPLNRSEEHTSELQSLMRTSYAVFCLKHKKTHTNTPQTCTT